MINNFRGRTTTRVSFTTDPVAEVLRILNPGLVQVHDHTPGSHGSTFGGNPLAAAIGHAVVGLLATGTPGSGAGAGGPPSGPASLPCGPLRVGHGRESDTVRVGTV